MENEKQTIRIVIEVVEGKGFSISHPVIVCRVGKGKTKTKSKKSCWGEILDLECDLEKHSELLVQLCEARFLDKQVVGSTIINLHKENLGFAKSKEAWYDIKSDKGESGQIKLRLKLAQGGIPKKNVSLQPPEKKRRDTRQKGVTAIHSLIVSKDATGLSEFLSKATPEDVNITVRKNGNTPLHEACIERHEQILTLLLNFEGIQVNQRNSDDNTALHYFCEKWNSPAALDTFNLFIKRGADVNIVNSNGETPIFKAIFNPSIRVLLVEALIQNGAEVNTISKTGEGVLHYAVRLGRSDLVNLILRARPKLDLKGSDGHTPRELATIYGHTRIATHLKQIEELFQWMDENELAEYKPLFIKHEVNLSSLPDFTDDNLIKMGIDAVGTRMKIIQAISKLAIEPAGMPQFLTSNSDDLTREKNLDDLQNELKSLRQGKGDIIIDGKHLEYTKHLGTGAAGDVYRGIYNEKTIVAIKVLKETTAEQEREEFKKEFEILSAVIDNNVVFLYGASMVPRLCMVMEYCSRGSLHNVMKDVATDILWERALIFCKETCLGLRALHENKPQIFHRDLKSLNLLVTQEWHIKLADFGLSRFVVGDNMETMKQMRGTFAYCDPEVYNGAAFSAASDIYSLGIIIWEIMNRVIKGKYEQPYSEYKNITFDFQIIIQAAKEHLRPTIPATCPSSLKQVIQKCLHKSQSGRPSLKELTHKFDDIMQEYKLNQTEWEKVRGCATK